MKTVTEGKTRTTGRLTRRVRAVAWGVSAVLGGCVLLPVLASPSSADDRPAPPPPPAGDTAPGQPGEGNAPPTSRPTLPPPPGGGRFNGPPPDGRFGGPFGRPPGPATQPAVPSPAEWVEVANFMSSLSPRKWGSLDDLDDKPWKQHLRAGIAARYRDLQRLKADDPAAYDLAVARIKIEDDIFGTMIDFRQASKDPQKQQGCRTQMRQLVRNFKENLQKDREHRLAQSKQRLAALQQEITKLEQEIAKSDLSEDAVNQSAERMLTAKRGFGGGRPPGMHRGDRDRGERDRGDRSQRGDRPDHPDKSGD